MYIYRFFLHFTFLFIKNKFGKPLVADESFLNGL